MSTEGGAGGVSVLLLRLRGHFGRVTYVVRLLGPLEEFASSGARLGGDWRGDWRRLSWISAGQRRGDADLHPVQRGWCRAPHLGAARKRRSYPTPVRRAPPGCVT